MRVRDLPTMEWFRFLHAVEVNNGTLWFYQSKPTAGSSKTERIKAYRTANANNDVSMYHSNTAQPRLRKLFVNANADEIEQGTQIVEAMQGMKHFGKFITQIVVDSSDGLFAAFESTGMMELDESDACLRMQQRVCLSANGLQVSLRLLESLKGFGHAVSVVVALALFLRCSLLLASPSQLSALLLPQKGPGARTWGGLALCPSLSRWRKSCQRSWYS